MRRAGHRQHGDLAFRPAENRAQPLLRLRQFALRALHLLLGGGHIQHGRIVNDQPAVGRAHEPASRPLRLDGGGQRVEHLHIGSVQLPRGGCDAVLHEVRFAARPERQRADAPIHRIGGGRRAQVGCQRTRHALEDGRVLPGIWIFQGVPNEPLHDAGRTLIRQLLLLRVPVLSQQPVIDRHDKRRVVG